MFASKRNVYDKRVGQTSEWAKNPSPSIFSTLSVSSQQSDNVRDKQVLQTSKCSKNPSTYIITIQLDIFQQPNMSHSSNEAKIILAL
jgi:hypothetical protein